MNKPNQIWQRAGKDLLDSLQSGPQGLTTKEAQQRLEKYGPNELQEGGKKSGIRIFLEQFADFLVIILIVAAVISAVLGDVESMVVILAVITMNAILGTVQTIKAEASLDSLKQMSAPTAKVVRDGKTIQIPGRDVVPGDIVVLEAGDAVCADGRLLESASLKTAESALTGESLPVEKEETPIEAEDVPLGDRKNMVFSGTFVTYGRGRFLVTGTGMETEMGKIASLLKTTSEKKTPLQVSLDNFGKKLSIGILVLCAILFAVSVLVRGENVMSAFLFAVALAVAAIPEALSSIVTIVLSFGTRKMAKEHAIIRKLQAVEGLGSVSVICSDKTGTLTQNKMTVRQLYVGGRVIPAAQADFKDPIQEPLLRAALLCSDATVNEQGEIGDPTETALVRLGEDFGFDELDVREHWPRLGELPFDSDRKLMSTLHQFSGGYMLMTKGAVDVLLDRTLLGPGEREEIERVNQSFSEQGLRVLAFACRRMETMEVSLEDENNLLFLGLIAMMDPPREESKQAVAECIAAGIRPVMITGDHKDTAVAIAKELGILDDPSQAVTGSALDSLSDEELAKEVEKYSVYARVQPEHKVRIVNAWRKRGCVTAMTGDGVNDAPSIKSADIGVGMGITGTDVTKNVADMVLADDNFATIVGAVEEGRRIYDNIRKSIQFLLGSNMSEVLSIFLATLLGFVILKPSHLLWINLITDCFPALALGMEQGVPDLMERPPRDPKDGIFAGGLGVDVAYQGVLVTILTMGAYFIGHYMEAGVWEIANSPDGTTMAFLTMSMAEIFHSFNMRSQRHSIFHMQGHNRFLWGAMALSLVLTTAAIYLPGISAAFGFTHISLAEYGVALALAFGVIPIVELVKALQRRLAKKS